MPVSELLVFSSTPDVAEDNFVVPILAEPLERLAARARVLGFDGLEFLPNPDVVPDAEALAATSREGAPVMVVNSGRLRSKGYALLHKDGAMRARSVAVFKRLIELGGALGARIGLGMARGDADSTAAASDLPGVMRDVFAEIAEHAHRHGTLVMLEPADPGYVAAILRVREAAEIAREIASPGFRIMLDTYQLAEVEETIPGGFAAAGGLASHIHLYDPRHWPPGVLPEGEQLDWTLIRRSMDESGFSGTGSTVLAPEGDVEAAARASLAFLRRQLGKARA